MDTPGHRCERCGETYADRWRCTCGGPVSFAETPTQSGDPPDPAGFDTRRGLWSYDALLPVEQRVSLNEGATPLVAAPAWNAEFKLEYVFPTGSFKDRGATTVLSRALAVGAERVVEDSSGNAGAAIATYAARAGLDARIFVPASVKPAKLRAIRDAGAEVVRVEGTRGDVTDACLDAVENGDAFYASHAWRPSFLAGTATVAYEIAHARDWTAPDALVVPVGHGTLFLGAYRGFRQLAAAGWIDSLPRLYAAQAVGHAPIVAALADADHDGGPITPDDRNDADPIIADDRNDTDPITADDRNDAEASDTTSEHPPSVGASNVVNERADGIAIDDPVRQAEIVRAIRETGGGAVAIDGEATDRALTRLTRHGFDTEPTCATAPAALRVFRDHGAITDADDVVVPLTGSGLKRD